MTVVAELTLRNVLDYIDATTDGQKKELRKALSSGKTLDDIVLNYLAGLDSVKDEAKLNRIALEMDEKGYALSTDNYDWEITGYGESWINGRLKPGGCVTLAAPSSRSAHELIAAGQLQELLEQYGIDTVAEWAKAGKEASNG